MIRFKQKVYVDLSGMDWLAKKQYKKFRDNMAKEIKDARKANSKLMTGEDLINANTASREQVSKKTKEMAEKLRKQSANRAKIGKRTGYGALAAAGTYGAYKLYKHTKENNENMY